MHLRTSATLLLFLDSLAQSGAFLAAWPASPISRAAWPPGRPCAKSGAGHLLMEGREANLSRRQVLSVVAAAGIAAPAPSLAVKAGPKLDQLPEDEWQSLVASGQLSKTAFNVLHNQATEKPFTSQLLKEKRPGTFACAACKTPLFVSSKKFDSGTGWPSFYDKLPGVELETGNIIDQLSFMCEVHCVKCGGHLGHVFDDGVLWETPTGKRYCINGVSLTFKPEPDAA